MVTDEAPLHAPRAPPPTTTSEFSDKTRKGFWPLISFHFRPLHAPMCAFNRVGSECRLGKKWHFNIGRFLSPSAIFPAAAKTAAATPMTSHFPASSPKLQPERTTAPTSPIDGSLTENLSTQILDSHLNLFASFRILGSGEPVQSTRKISRPPAQAG